MRTALAVVAGLLVVCAGATGSRSPVLRPSACWFPALPGVRIDCSRLTVPENRERPDGRQLELAVALFHSRSKTPRPDPVLFVTGGPGGAGIALVRYVSEAYAGPFLHDRDLIVLDPRGTGWSKPALTCRRGEDAPDCLLRWRRAGVDLAQYHSSATADDIEDLRLALGIERWNVYGLSYGTRQTLTLLRKHPQHVRSVILDSVVAPQLDEVASTSANAARAIQRLVDRCAADKTCRRSYPDLPEALRQAVERLEREPLSLPDGSRLDGARLLSYTYSALYDAPDLRLLPRAITAARNGRLDPLWPRRATAERQIALLVSEGAHLAWICNEMIPFTTPARVAAADRRHPEVSWLFSGAHLFDVCAASSPARPPAVENRAVRSDVPALLLTGRFDPVSPVENARRAARTLPRGHVVEFPTLGHGILGHDTACARRMVRDFLAAPGRPPETTCVARMPPVAWALRTVP